MSILSEFSEPATPVAEEATPVVEQNIDELLDTLAEETKERPMGTSPESYNYPDFTPEPPPAEPEPTTLTSQAPPSQLRDPLKGVKGLEDIDADSAESVLTDLAALPAETIVDTVDVLATEFVISRYGIKDYDGEDGDTVITSEKDKKALVKATESYLASQHIKVTPLTALLVTVCLIYGKKIMHGARIKNIMRRNKKLEAENNQLQKNLQDRERETERTLEGLRSELIQVREELQNAREDAFHAQEDAKLARIELKNGTAVVKSTSKKTIAAKVHARKRTKKENESK
jgi:hypothetical protein